MVSIRRRKLLGLCTGKNTTSVQLCAIKDNAAAVVEGPNQNVKAESEHPFPSHFLIEQKQVDISTAISTSSKEESPDQHLPEVKRRKKYRRKHVDDQEHCAMRGVYFKNMKWQAAIKVDKKQIHLGTCGSQEEAARLYDRAAFMCGREPNFDLSEGEKQELRRFKWEEFLAMTRDAITNKKQQKRTVSGRQRMGGSPSPTEWATEKDAEGTTVSDGGADGSRSQ